MTSVFRFISKYRLQLCYSREFHRPNLAGSTTLTIRSNNLHISISRNITTKTTPEAMLKVGVEDAESEAVRPDGSCISRTRGSLADSSKQQGNTNFLISKVLIYSYIVESSFLQPARGHVGTLSVNHSPRKPSTQHAATLVMKNSSLRHPQEPPLGLHILRRDQLTPAGCP